MLFSETLDGKERTDHGPPGYFPFFDCSSDVGVYMSVISLQPMEALSEAVEMGE